MSRMIIVWLHNKIARNALSIKHLLNSKTSIAYAQLILPQSQSLMFNTYFQGTEEYIPLSNAYPVDI